MLVKRDIPHEVINYDMCKLCGGLCCRQTPCEYLPTDFALPKIENIEQAIVSNLAIIDEGYLKTSTKKQSVYYLRTRTYREDLNKMQINNKSDIYLSKLGRKGTCLYYKAAKKYYCGIEYDKYNEEKILSLNKIELLKLFKMKQQFEGIAKPIEVCVQEYLDARKEEAWGGCLLSEEQRPSGGLYIVPDFRSDGNYHCKELDLYRKDSWATPENQEVLKRILEKNC